jgi:hypothetical protein
METVTTVQLAVSPNIVIIKTDQNRSQPVLTDYCTLILCKYIPLFQGFLMTLNCMGLVARVRWTLSMLT